jgi:hypothetical protein
VPSFIRTRIRPEITTGAATNAVCVDGRLGHAGRPSHERASASAFTQMTQVEVAPKLGVGQGVVSRLEHRDDMLLSTLYDYLTATGAEGAGIVVIVRVTG